MNKQDRFWELYEPCSENLWKFVISFINNKFDAKDIISDTILLAYDSFDKLKQDKAFLSYLFTIARRLIYRKTFFNKKIDGSKQFEADDICSEDYSPEKINQLNELYAALDKLPRKLKESLFLTSINGFSYVKAAEIQNTSVENIRKSVYRAKKKLQEILG